VTARDNMCVIIFSEYKTVSVNKQSVNEKNSSLFGVCLPASFAPVSGTAKSVAVGWRRGRGDVSYYEVWALLRHGLGLA